jgi:hypothetical protein
VCARSGGHVQAVSSNVTLCTVTVADEVTFEI